MANAADSFQWNKDNVFQYGKDLNPLAQQVGAGADGVRDTLAANRDAYLQPMMADYRQKMLASGQRADEGDENLFNNQDFQSYVQTGAMPAAKTPTQQWSATSETNPMFPERQNEFFDLLMQRIKQPLTPDRDDPLIRGQADAYSANQTRQMRDTMADAAERGGPYTNLSADSRLAAERAGQASGAFESELMGREQDARRAEVQQALDLYGSQLTEQERQSLQMELAQMSDATQRYGMNLTNDQYLRRLGLDEWVQGNQDYYRRAGI